MLPSDFVTRYGTPIPRVVLVGAVPVVLAPPANDRYLLVVWATTLNVSVSPDADVDPLVSGTQLTPTSAPFILTHALHGSLVSMGYRVVQTVPAPAGSVTVLEGFMSEPTPLYVPQGVSDGRPEHAVQQYRSRGRGRYPGSRKQQ